MNSPLERFNSWLYSKTPDQYGQTSAKVYAWLLAQGFFRNDIIKGIEDMKYWLAQNENKPRAISKRHWSKFMKNWFRPNKFQRPSARLTPSSFE